MLEPQSSHHHPIPLVPTSLPAQVEGIEYVPEYGLLLLASSDPDEVSQWHTRIANNISRMSMDPDKSDEVRVIRCVDWFALMA